MKNSRLILNVFLLFFSSQCLSITANTRLESKLINFLDAYSTKIADKGYRSNYKIGNIDPRLTSRTCSNELQLSFNREPIKQSSVTVLVQCTDHTPWKLYISAKFDIYGQVATTTETIPKGAIITRAMLIEKEQIINEGRKAGFSNIEKLIGMIAKRTIRSDMVVSASQVKPPSLIKRGDSVVITAANDVISVRMNGTALMDGKLGQQISIRNTESKRTVKGRVTDRGHVLVAL